MIVKCEDEKNMLGEEITRKMHGWNTKISSMYLLGDVKPDCFI